MKDESQGDVSRDVLPKILVVDDELMNINVFQALLQELEYTCDTSLDGDAAIDRVVNRLAQAKEGKA